MHAIEKLITSTQEIYNSWNKGFINQGEALAQIQSNISVLERAVNKVNSNGSQSKIDQKTASQKFPHLDILSLNLKSDA